MQTATAEFRNQVELQFAGEQHNINEIVIHAKNEFDMIRSQTEARFTQLQMDTGAELTKLRGQIQAMEGGTSGRKEKQERTQGKEEKAMNSRKEGEEDDRKGW